MIRFAAVLIGLAGAEVWAQGIPTGQYGPVFEESGLREDGHYFDLGFDATVNPYGGNLIVSSVDVSLPHQGRIGLSFRRTFNSNKCLAQNLTPVNDVDSPLGYGWTGHYGVLILPGQAGGTNSVPQFIDSSGSRHLFYSHNVLNAILPLRSDRLSQGPRISSSLAILVQPDFARSEYHLYTPDGLIYVFTQPPGSPVYGSPNPPTAMYPNFYVPTQIFDVFGNSLTLTYEEFQGPNQMPQNAAAWYALHPLVKTVTDNIGRTLTFDYEVIHSDRKRLKRVKLGATILASYEYVARGHNPSARGSWVFLDSHSTAEGRITAYGMEFSVPANVVCQLGQIMSRTGGILEFSYDFRQIDSSPRGGVPKHVYAVTEVRRQGYVWEYRYPSPTQVSQQRYVAQVRCYLPTDTHRARPVFLGDYTFYTYGQNEVTNGLDMWKVGQLTTSTETFNGTSTTRNLALESFLVSRDPAYGQQNGITTEVRVGRRTHESYTYGNVTLTTDYHYDSSDSLNLPDRIEGPGATEKRRFTYRHLATGQRLVANRFATYLRGIKASEKLTFGPNDETIQETNYEFRWSTDVLPRAQKLRRTQSQEIEAALEFWDLPGKAGALKRKTVGNSDERFEYEAGVLKSIRYAMGPNLDRIVHPNGTARQETVNGVTRNFAWDNDFRLTRVEAPDSDPTTITYPNSRSVRIQQGTGETSLVSDDWGRLTIRAEKVEGNQFARDRNLSFDPFGRPLTVETRTGARYVQEYDVYGRLLRRSLINATSQVYDSHTYAYVHHSDGSITTTDTQNSSVVRVKTVDPLGRITSGSTNGHEVTYRYTYEAGNHPIHQTIAPAGQNERSVWFDLLGNKVKEQHPETGTITYGFTEEGWLQKVDRPGLDHFYVYDARGRVTSTHEGLSASGTMLTRSTYHPTYGSVQRKENLLDGVTTEYDLPDAAGRPTKLTTRIRCAIPAPTLMYPRGRYQEIGPQDRDFGKFLWSWVFLPSSGNRSVPDRYEIEIYQVSGYGPNNPQLLVRQLLPVGQVATFSRLGFFADLRTLYFVRIRAHTTSGEVGPFSALTYFSRGRAGNLPRLPRDPWSPIYIAEEIGSPQSSEIDRVFEVNLSYDGRGRVTRIQSINDNAVDYTHNELGSEKTVAWGGWPIVTNTRFEDSGLTRESQVDIRFCNTFASRRQVIANRTYDVLGRGTSLRITENGGAQTLYRVRNVHYNAWGFLQDSEREDRAFPQATTFEYEYTEMGQLETFAVGGLTQTYRYDPKGNLTSYDGGLHHANSYGLRDLWLDTEFDSHNRRQDYRYDADGRLTQDSQWDYRYTKLGQTSELSKTDHVSAQFRYDADGRRVCEMYDDKAVYSVHLPDGRLILKETVFQENQWPTWATRRKALRQHTVYYQGQPILSDLGSFRTGRHELVYEFYDARKNLALEIAGHGTAGSAVHPEYAPYGWELKRSSFYHAPFQFGGHQKDEYEGDRTSYYMYARHYDSWFGRFKQPDPAFDFDERNPSTFNLYAYARGNPVNFVDPDGREATALIIVPAQGRDAAAFLAVAQELRGRVYGGEAVIVRGRHGSDHPFKLENEDGTPFSIRDVLDLSTVMVLSHAGPLDGPNIAYGAERGGYQPWRRSEGMGLDVDARGTWALIGALMASDGKIILMGCNMGYQGKIPDGRVSKVAYGQAIADVSRRDTYATRGKVRAGLSAVVVPIVESIEHSGRSSVMQRFTP